MRSRGDADLAQMPAVASLCTVTQQKRLDSCRTGTRRKDAYNGTIADSNN
jgi:hypothetical protein